MCHVSAFIVLKYPDANTLEFQMGNIPNGICRACIPLFVMLSGALLLNENKKFDTKSFYKKSLLWMVLLLVGWLLIYALFYAFLLPLMLHEEIQPDSFLNYIISFKGSDYPHLWYMFMCVGLYLMTPVFRLFVKKENVKYIVGIVIAAIIYTFLMKTLNIFMVGTEKEKLFTDFISKFHLEGLGGYVAYFLLGWLFDNFKLKKLYRYIIYGLGLISVIGSILIVQFLYNDMNTVRNFVSADLALPVLFYGAAVYLLIDTLCGEKTHESKIITALSVTSFGVYVIHVFIEEIFTRVLLTPERCDIHPMLYFLMIYGIVVVLSFLISFLISKIKGFRKIIHIK